MRPYQQYIPEKTVQFLLRQATGTTKVWTAYSTDKIEEVLRIRGLINKDTYYSSYNANDGYLIFSSQAYVNSKFKFTWKERFRILFKGI